MKIQPEPWRPPPRTIDDIRDDPSRFPREVLQGSKTALCMFAAQWHGRQDAYWLAEAGLRTTCIDLQPQKLAEMQRVYPPDWTFLEADAFTFTEDLSGSPFDVVTADPFTGETMERCHQLMGRWCGMANHVVIMGSTAAQPLYPQRIPDGWRITDTVHRSTFAGGVFWTVVKPS